MDGVAPGRIRLARLADERFWRVVLSAAVGAYVVTRAVVLPIVHDEAVTYFAHASGSVAEIIGHRGVLPANNHLLNTLLMKLCRWLFGSGELALRLPALLGLALFLVGSYRLVTLLPRPESRIPAALLLLCQPFLLDYLCVARGYALGLGFMAMGTAGLARLASASAVTTRELVTIPTWWALAVLANLVFAPVFAVALLCFVVESRRARAGATALAAVLAAVSGVTVVLGPSTYRMVVGGHFFAGGRTGLWQDTVHSLAEATLAEAWSGRGWLVSLVVLLGVLVVATSVALVGPDLVLGHPRPAARRVLTVLVALVVGPLLVILGQALVLRTHYPTGRMVIYLLPLVLTVGLWRAAEIDRWWGRGLVILVAVGAAVNLLAEVNLSHHRMWRYDASTPEMLSVLEGMTAGGARLERPLRLGVHWVLEPSVNFYLHRRRIWWLEPVDRAGIDRPFDVYYLALPADQELAERRHLRIVERFPVSGLALAIPEQGPLSGS